MKNDHRHAPKADIPSLTGLRFFAAACILLNHLLLGIMPVSVFPALAPSFMSCGVLGMDLFFVLSGFIIHYNYRASLSRVSVLSVYDFLTARIARLYPLLFLFVAFELLTEDYVWQADAISRNAQLRALPYFLTFGQTWGYQHLTSDQSLAYAFQNASITWSISTEFFMYLCYPLLLHALLPPAENSRLRLIKVLLLGLLFAGGTRFLLNHVEAVNHIGVEWFGKAAGINGTAPFPSGDPFLVPYLQLAQGPHSFALWFLLLSPYVRIGEFLVGALCAHLFLGAAGQGLSRRGAITLSGLAILATVSIGASLLPWTRGFPPLAAWQAAFGYMPAIALIVYACARGGHLFVPRLLAWRPFVWAGEASYSIYLIHIVFYSRFRAAPELLPWAVLKAVLTFGCILLVARALFEMVEKPARKGLRGFFRRLAFGSKEANPKPILLSES